MARLPRFRQLSGGALGLLVLISACDLFSSPVPATASAISGTGQTATVGTAVSSAPSLKVLDEKGEPFAGLPVTFTVTGGGGSVTIGSTTTSTTGVASVGSWTLGTTAGTNTVIGTPEGLSAVTFTATGTAGSPTTITVNAGESQAGIVGADVAAPPSVLLEDSYHNPVPQVSVTFEVTSGGGTVSGGTATTNSSGIAAVGSWTMGTLPGTNTLQATYTGLTPISFSATAEADVPAVVNLLSGDGQAATVGTQLPVLPTVEVTDQYANVLEGVGVVFAVASGGGTISGESQTTNSSGTATLGSWTLGTTAGTQTLSATVGELTPATITATAVADVPTTLQGATEATQTGTVGLDVDELPTVLVQDQFGNGVPGITVTFTETAAPSPLEAEGEEGARRVVTGGTVTTDANGEASPTSWVLGTTAGLYKLTATVQGLASPVVFQATADPDVASIILIHSGDNQSALFGTALAAPARVKVTDQYGNPIEGVQVVFAVASGGGSITGETATTGADGIAAVGSWTMGPAPATNTLTATAGQIGSVTFTATGTALVPANIAVAAGNNQSATVNTAVATPPQVLVTTSDGTPVPNVLVTFAVTSGGGSVAGATATTDSNGLATLGSWTLGTLVGTNTVSALAGSVGPVTITATGTSGPAAAMAINDGNNQTAQINTDVATPPSVVVTDAFGNLVQGATVIFTVNSGGGSVSGGTAVTNANGIATVGSWTLGSTVGAQSLTVTTTGVTPLQIDAIASVDPPLNLSVEAVHLNQANQARLGTIGSIAGRAALLRVLVKASSANTETPDVRIRLYNGATLLREVTVSAPRSGVPTTANLNVLTDTWNVVLNAGEVVAGLRVEVMVDPSGSITDFNLADNRFPQGGGTASLDVQTIPDLNIVFIPIIATTNSTTGSINAGNEASFLTAVRQLLAVSTINTVHHAAFTTAHDLSVRQGWGDLLSDIQALRTAEGATDQYYHGIVGDMSPIGSGGWAYVPFSNASGFRSSLSYDRQPWAAGTVAHETGHNLGLWHAPCGGAGDLDASYPYANAQIGPPGYDVTTGSFMNATNLRDFMSYCRPAWISDYNYNKLVQWRRTDPLASPPRSSSAAKGGSRTNGLLVWGRIDSEGVTLNPAFALEAPPSLPEADGPNQLRAVSADGRELFRFSFLGAQLADSPDPNERHFAYFVPLSAADVREVARIELATPRGAAAQGSRSTDQAVRVGGVSLEPEVRLARRAGGFVRVQWNDALYPMAIVRDPATGQILSFARGGDVEVDASGLNMESLQILVSDGAKTRVVRQEIR